MSPDPNPIAERRTIGRAHFAFTSRHGGVSAAPFGTLNVGLHVGDDAEPVTENRRRVVTALGLGDRLFCEAEQVHGADVAQPTRRSDGSGRCVAPGADALVASAGDPVALMLFYADCVPVFIADSERTIVLAHAGWRGTAGGITHEAAGHVRGDPHAVIGPSVGICCYEVGEDVAEAVLATVPAGERAGLAREGAVPGKWHIDLAGINARQLVNAGVAAERIEVVRRCTCCENDTFFSVRGDGETTGRCAAVAWVA